MSIPIHSLRLATIFLSQVSLLVVLPLLGLAQITDRPAFQCETKSLSLDAQRALDTQARMALRLKQVLNPASKARRAFASAYTMITYIPVRPHIGRKSDGTGGYDLASLNNVMALTNKQYLQNGTGIQFYFAGTTPDYIDDDALYAQYSESAFASHDVNNALNQYYVHNGPGPYAYFPYNSVASTRSFLPDATNNDDYMGNNIVPHELGHNFNLLHTFEAGYGYEMVTRGAGANCATTGDLVCDTPADPYGRFPDATANCKAGCPPTYTCTFRDDQNNVYTPSLTNIMSYYFACIHDFTPGQGERMQAGLALRQSHTAYTLDAPAIVMAAPSNVVAKLINNAIVITWQDNASNEMGYFVERSTSPTTGFIPIGGVAPNVTTFTNGSFTPGITYYYRIRASNTTTGSISPTAMIAPTDYCRPMYTSDGCPSGNTINSVTFNGTALSQNSGCSPASSNYYSSFTAVSGTVTVGQSTTFTITKGTQSNMGIYIWADLNNDNFFAIGERLFQMPPTTQTSTVTGSLTIPAGTPANTVAMRIITAYETVNDPCGTYALGETEDYRLIINSACTTMYSLKAGNWNDPSIWSCGRLPTELDDVTIQADHRVLLDSTMVEAVCRNLEIIGTFSMQGSTINIGGNRLVVDESSVVTK